AAGVPVRLRPNLLGRGPRTDLRRAGAAAGSDPEIRVASAVAARRRTGNLTALNLHLLFLLRGRRLRRGSPTQTPMGTEQVPCPGCRPRLLKGEGNLWADHIEIIAFSHGYCAGPMT